MPKKTANNVREQKHGEGNMKTKTKRKVVFFHWIIVCVDHELVNDAHNYIK